MPKARVGDIDMYYRVEGSGQPLVMIIGYSANSDWWPPGLVDSLAARYQVILVDNRGAGRTNPGRRCFTIPLMAADTVGLLDALDIAGAHIFGISMGGMISQEIALSHPHRVHKLILGHHLRGPRSPGIGQARPALVGVPHQARRAIPPVDDQPPFFPGIFESQPGGFKKFRPTGADSAHAPQHPVETDGGHTPLRHLSPPAQYPGAYPGDDRHPGLHGGAPQLLYFGPPHPRRPIGEAGRMRPRIHRGGRGANRPSHFGLSGRGVNHEDFISVTKAFQLPILKGNRLMVIHLFRIDGLPVPE
ncbi:MAG: alpha/beta fold hydrolase [Desulfobacteraceae bacterium]|nr:alpha/beta fold hydrolase [Desulfobacteraceae bacterium]